MEFNSLPLSRYSKEPYLALRILVHSFSSLTAIIQLIFANNAEMISLKVEGNSLSLWLDLIIVTRPSHSQERHFIGLTTKSLLSSFWLKHWKSFAYILVKNRGDPSYFELAPSLLKPDLWQKLVHHAITHIPYSKSSPHLAKFMACPDHWQYFWTHC